MTSLDDVFIGIDRIDIGHGTSIAYTSWGTYDQVGLIEWHNGPDGEPCGQAGGGVLFDLPGVKEAFPGRALWRVESLEPLTLWPSIACLNCGHHGWIRNGRWEPA